MKPLIPLVFLLAVLCACERMSFRSEGDRIDPGKSSHSLYCSAFVYPDGYDWRKDSLAGDVPVKLMLFDRKDTLLSLDVGGEYLVGADADMHRIIGGALYCDFSTSTQTVVSRNGIEIFRYDGRECMTGFALRGSDVYTLGSARSGSGWSFRKNGELILGRETGAVMGGLYEDGDSLCFAFYEPITSGFKVVGKRYYCACGSKVTQVVPGADVTEIYALRMYGSQVNYLASSTNIKGILWQSGWATMLMDSGNALAIRAHGFILAGDTLYAFAQRRTSFWWSDTFWRGSRIEEDTGDFSQVYAIRDGSPSLCYVYSRNGTPSGVGLYFNGRRTALPEKYIMPCSSAYCCKEKTCCVGLNDTDTKDCRPLVINGVDTLEYSFNGYFTGLCLP